MPHARVDKKLKLASSPSSQLLISAVAGGILGATAALLLTTNSGTKLRRNIFETCKGIHPHTQEVEKDKYSRASLCLGALAGCVLGAGLIYYLRSNREEIEESMGHKIKEASKAVVNNATDWIETAKDVVDTIHEKVHQFDEEVETEAEEASTNLNEILEWAQLGLRVWNNLQKRK